MDIEVKRNDQGKIISGIPKLRRPEYGTGVLHKGIPQVNWGYHAVNADNDGFDITNIEENGYYLIEIVLPKGTRLIRYGGETTGHFTAPEGTDYETLSLPYLRETREFHIYEVRAENMRVKCVVKKGKVAPMFDEPGGGIQYYHEKTIRVLRNEKVLKEVSYIERK